MKKLNFLIVLLVLLTLTGLSQVPDAFNYQAVVRNSSGEVISNQNVSFRISILKNSTSGTVVYSETQNKQTNSFGLVNLKIGKGTRVSGSFNPANWGTSSHFIKIEFDANGGSSYALLGTSELLSVPYAFHAQTVEIDKVDDADADATNEIQELQISGTQLSLSKNGGTVTLPSSGGGDNWGTQTVVSDATLSGKGTTSDPLTVVGDLTDNQTLSIKYNLLSIKDGNTVTLPVSTSPWNIDGSSIYVTNKRVGIGENPEGSEISFRVKSSTDLAISAENNSSLPTLSLHNKSGKVAAWIVGEVVINDGTQGDGKILTSNGSGYAHWETPDFSPWRKSGSTIHYDSGPVGIGTTTTHGLLNLNSKTDHCYICFNNNATGTRNVDGMLMGITDSNSRAYIWNYENTPLTFATNSASRMTIDNTGYIGIGTDNPAAGLHLKGNGYPASFMYLESNSGQDAGFRLYEGTTAQWHIFNNATSGGLQIYNSVSKTAIFAKQSNSYVGIGTTNPTQALHVVGNAYKTSGGTSWATSSDIRLKNVLGNYSKGLKEITALKPVRYMYKKDNPRQLDSETEQVGFVAQEVQKIFPEAVSEAEDGYLDFNIHPINIAFVNAIKELKSENDQLSAKVKSLESRLAELESFVKASASK